MCLTMDAFGDKLSAAREADKETGLTILETRPFSNSRSFMPQWLIF